MIIKILSIKNIFTYLFLFIVITTYSGDKKLIPVTVLILIFIFFGIVFLKKNIKLYKFQKTYSLVFLFWIIYLCFSTIYSPSILYGTNKLLFITFYYIFGLVLMFSNIAYNINKHSIFMALVMLVVMYFSFGTPIEALSNTNNKFYRLGSEAESNPIVLARGLGLIIILMLFSFNIRKSVISKILIISVIFITFLYMFVSGSKGPALSLFLSLIFLNILFTDGIKYKLIGVVFVCLFAFSIKYFDFGDGFLAERYLNQGSATSRFDQYKLIINSIVDSNPINLIFGYGLGGYSYISSGTDIRDYPHNLILEVVYELGVVGFFLLIWLFLYPIHMQYKYKKKINAYTVILLFFIINAQFSGDLLSNTMWIIFAFLTLSSIPRNELNKL